MEEDPAGGDHLTARVARGGSSADGVGRNGSDEAVGGGEDPGAGKNGTTANVRVQFLDGDDVWMSLNGGGSSANDSPPNVCVCAVQGSMGGGW